MQHAGFYRRKKPLVLAGGQKSLKCVDVAANMRRLFGSCGGASRQNVPVTEDGDESLGGDRDQEARATCKKAKKQGAGQKGGVAPPRLVGIVRGGS